MLSSAMQAQKNILRPLPGADLIAVVRLSRIECEGREAGNGCGD